MRNCTNGGFEYALTIHSCSSNTSSIVPCLPYFPNQPACALFAWFRQVVHRCRKRKDSYIQVATEGSCGMGCGSPNVDDPKGGVHGTCRLK
jgi:hypothetical protein